MSHAIAFYLHNGHQLLDLAGPLDAFRAANEAAGRCLYSFSFLSRQGGAVIGNAGAPVGTEAWAPDSCDTLMIVGGTQERLRDPQEVAAIHQIAPAAARIASICTGAFLLAEAGLLNGRRATTHWGRTRELAEDFPDVEVLPDRIFVRDGPTWTSAGITAGIDLALALIEADHGAALARMVARELLVYHRRSGGQSQFSALSEMAPETERIRRALTFAREHLQEALPVERLAEAARLSPRQFSRAFLADTGETPAHAVTRLRVEAARLRIEESAVPIEQIAEEVGFSDPERMRRAFLKHFGQPPQALRRAARQARRDG